MPRPRRVVPVVLSVCALLVAGALPAAQATPATERALPETVVVKDSRTSDPSVDIAKVELEASWYWDSEHYVRVQVPNGYRPGQRLTVFFDLDEDSKPDGHYDLKLLKPGKPGGKYLKKEQEFRLGGGWEPGSGELVRCSDGEGFRPAGDVKLGSRWLALGFDLWWCLKTPNPEGADQGSWRAAVRLAKGGKADMAPNGRRWSQLVAGWGPCDPSGGSCP